MIAIAKSLPKPPKEDDEGGQTEENDDETIEAAQTPLTFEKGGQATQDEHLEVNFDQDEDPHPHSSKKTCLTKKRV